MKVYIVTYCDCEDNHIFSTLDKAKEFCYKLAEDMFEEDFDKKDVRFSESEDCVLVDYDLDDIAIIMPYELDKD